MKLSEKQIRFINAYLDKAHAGDAAIAAGYDRSAGSRLLAHPAIASEISARRQTVAKEVNFDLNLAMRQLEEGIAISKQKGQMMAYMKGAELMGRLMGLYVEKMDVRQLTNFRINILGIPNEPRTLPQIDVSSPLLPNPSREVDVIDDKQFEEDIYGL